MSDDQIHIVSTRKIDLNNKDRALKNNVIIDDYNFLNITYLSTNEMKKALANSNLKFVFTSANAVESVYQFIQKNDFSVSSYYCYTIKGNTSDKAKSYGFNIINTSVDGKSLAEVIIKNNEKEVVHFTTQHNREELSNTLKSASISYISIMVYDKTINEIKIPNSFNGILFFSPSQIDGFFLHNSLKNSIPAFCIGQTTQSHLQSFHHQNIQVASSADESVLVDLVINYFNNIKL